MSGDGTLQNVSTLMYAALAVAGQDAAMLAASIGAETVTGGLREAGAAADWG